MADETHLHLEGRYTHLDSKVTHLDSRVTEISTDLAAIKPVLETLMRSVQTLVDRASNPRPTNWVGIGSLMLASMIGGGGYVQLTVQPMKENIAELQRKDQANDDLHAIRGAIQERLTTTSEFHGEAITLMTDVNVRLRDKIADTIEQVGRLDAAITAVRADIIRVDTFGSSAWIKREPVE